jgi:tryptophan synthase alpha chain
MTTQRIEASFAACKAESRPALIVYLTIGDPSVADSLACARAALAAGADMLELGVPFSDPSADGPTIAEASQRAIAGGGSLRAALALAQELRKDSDAPFVLFTYFNPVIAFGEAQLPAAAAAAGIDALLLVDLPPEEGAELRQGCRESELAVIPLVAPTTTPARAATLLRDARGFAYYVSVTGVTGTGSAPLAEAASAANALSRAHGLPVVVGFGVDSAAKAEILARAGVDGVVVGSAVVRQIASASSPAERVDRVGQLVTQLRSALQAR